MFWYVGPLFQLSLLVTVFTVNCTTTSKYAYEGDDKEFRLDTYEELRPYVFSKAPNISHFMKKGPYSFSVIKDFDIKVSKKENVSADIYYSSHKQIAPLVIFQHGNLADKNSHRNQARMVASWGMHAMIVSLPNKGRWMQNGKVLSKMVRLLHAWPELLEHSFDKNNIIVAGHSFGGSALAMAAGSRAPLKGAIFLDPALVDNKVKKYISKIEVPSVVIGADKKVFRARQRKAFYKNLKSDVVEISIKDSTHNDAQNPSLFSFPQMIGLEHGTSKEKQRKFTAAIIASAFSLASTGGNAYAWSAFQPAIKSGDIIQQKRK